MLSGIKQQGIVGKDGKIEIQTSELAEGTVVEVIILTKDAVAETSNQGSVLQESSLHAAPSQDETAHLLSTEANRQHLMDALKAVERETELVSFTAQEWDEKYNVQP